MMAYQTPSRTKLSLPPHEPPSPSLKLSPPATSRAPVFLLAQATRASKEGSLSIVPQEPSLVPGAPHLLALSRHHDLTYQRRLRPARGLGPDGVER